MTRKWREQVENVRQAEAQKTAQPSQGGLAMMRVGALALVGPPEPDRLHQNRMGGCMHIVSENSEQDLNRRDADERLGWALRQATANLLRVTRGAGKTYEVLKHAIDLVEAIVEYEKIWGLFPSDHVYWGHLNISADKTMIDRTSEYYTDLSYAEERIVRGALQIAASKLLQQRPQICAGETELHGGVQDMQRARDANRRTFLTQVKPEKAPIGRPKVRRRKNVAK